jgi:hypothetical protein
MKLATAVNSAEPVPYAVTPTAAARWRQAMRREPEVAFHDETASPGHSCAGAQKDLRPDAEQVAMVLSEAVELVGIAGLEVIVDHGRHRVGVATFEAGNSIRT